MKKGRRGIAAILVSVVVVIAIVSGSLAWYTSTTSSSRLAKLVGFQSSGFVYFEKDGKLFREQPNENGLYKLSMDANATNYIGNFRINVIQKGYAKYYVRVKLSVQWTMPDGSVAQNVTVPFTFAEKWYDNRTKDNCVYYTDTTGLFSSYDKSIITGFDEEAFLNASMAEGAIPTIAVTVESVQINRYQQIWGIDQLPWE